MNILNVKNLNISFGDFIAVKGVDFFVRKNKISAIVGESGSGKSVSCLSLLKLINGATIGGSADFYGKDLITLTEKELVDVRGSNISFIFQEPMTSLNPLHKVGNQIREALLTHGICKNKQEAKKEVCKLLKKVHINKSKYSSYPHQLSGGQRQRIMIAMAIACKPKLIIADEPTTALDVSIQKEILTLLKELQSNMGLSILIVTHDLGLVKEYADDIFVMEKGKIVEYGNRSIFNSPKHAYTKKLLKASEIGLSDNRDIVTDDIILDVKKLSISYGNSKAVDEVSFSIKKGEILGLIGESGSGKTSIANALLRLIPIDGGKIIFSGTEIQNLKEKEFRSMRKDIQVVFQDPFSSLSPRMSIYQILEEPLKIHKIGGKESRRKIVLSALEEVGLSSDIKDRYPHEFSGGQRQRVAIARALILKPELLILDEPTSALDVCVQADILKLLRNVQKKRQISFIFITHDLNVVKNSADFVVILKNGKKIESGKTAAVFNQPFEKYTKNILASIKSK